MRIFLLAVVVILGSVIGLEAMDSVKTMQDIKMQRYCQADPSLCNK